MNIRIELLTLQTGANKLSAAEFYAKFAAIADEYIRLQNLQQTECSTLRESSSQMLIEELKMKEKNRMDLINRIYHSVENEKALEIILNLIDELKPVA